MIYMMTTLLASAAAAVIARCGGGGRGSAAPAAHGPHADSAAAHPEDSRRLINLLVRCRTHRVRPRRCQASASRVRAHHARGAAGCWVHVCGPCTWHALRLPDHRPRAREHAAARWSTAHSVQLHSPQRAHQTPSKTRPTNFGLQHQARRLSGGTPESRELVTITIIIVLND